MLVRIGAEMTLLATVDELTVLVKWPETLRGYWFLEDFVGKENQDKGRIR